MHTACYLKLDLIQAGQERYQERHGHMQYETVLQSLPLVSCYRACSAHHLMQIIQATRAQPQLSKRHCLCVVLWHQVFMHGQRSVTLPLWFSCRNKVIWVGIFSQIGIALILTYGLGHATALNFTPLR